MLEKFRKAKQKEIESLRQMRKKGSFPPPRQGERPDFRSALAQRGRLPVAVIAEYKCASPSRGVICANVAPEDAARQYMAEGANALSILTETNFFQGDFNFLERAFIASAGKLPMLRKDFIFDPIQIDATAASPASALLLIVRFTPEVSTLRNLRELAERYGLQCVVEIFDKNDLNLARESGAGIIQANARDLSTLKVDKGACLKLIEKSPPLPGEIWIQASGISTPAHLEEAAKAGFDAALVGTTLMMGGAPGKSLRKLLEPFQ